MSKKGGQKMYDAICESCLLPVIEGLLKERSQIDEISKDDDGPFRCCLNIIKCFTKSEDLVPLVLSINMAYKPVQSESIYSLINSSKNQMEVMVKTRKDAASKAYFTKYFDH